MFLAFAGCAKQAEKPEKVAPLTADQPLRVEARVDKATAAVGDKVLFTVQAVARNGVDVFLPSDLVEKGGIEIRGSETPEPKKLGSDVIYRRYWTISPSKVGSYIYPAMEISYRVDGKDKTVQTTPVYLEVPSVLKPGDLEGDIRDIKSPVGLPSPLLMILCIIGGAFLLAGIALLVYRWWKNRPPKVPPLLPHEWALLELDKLAASGLMEAGQYKEFAEKLTDIFRIYVEKRFRISAPERTTEEFIAEMRGRQEFTQDQKGLVGKLLVFCDMIKFAKYAPQPSEMSEGVTIVRGFVEQTRPQPEPKDKDKAKVAA